MISELDLSSNPKLALLSAEDNSLRCLDLSSNSMLAEVHLEGQKIRAYSERKEEFNLKEFLNGKPFIFPEQLGAEYSSESGIVKLLKGSSSFSYLINVTEGSAILPKKMMEVNVSIDFVSSGKDFYKAYINGYEDGSFKPEGSMTRAEAAAVFSRLLNEKKSETLNAEAASYNDISGGWYEKDIDYVSSMGLMNGYPDGSFKPDNQISRAEMAKLIYEEKMRMGKLEEDSKEKSPFNDISGH